MMLNKGTFTLNYGHCNTPGVMWFQMFGSLPITWRDVPPICLSPRPPGPPAHIRCHGLGELHLLFGPPGTFSMKPVWRMVQGRLRKKAVPQIGWVCLSVAEEKWQCSVFNGFLCMCCWAGKQAKTSQIWWAREQTEASQAVEGFAHTSGLWSSWSS